MWDSPEAIPLTPEDRRTLEAWVAARTTPQRLAFRARIVLFFRSGLPVTFTLLPLYGLA